MSNKWVSETLNRIKNKPCSVKNEDDLMLHVLAGAVEDLVGGWNSVAVDSGVLN